MKKRLLSVAAIFVSLAVTVFAQVSVDPSEDFYYEVERWETLGLIEQQQPLRPYSAEKVKNILKTVIECHNDIESEKAAAFYEIYFSKPVNGYIDVLALGRISSIEDKEKDLKKIEPKGTSVLNLNGEVSLANYFGLGYKIGGVIDTNLGDKDLRYTLRPYSLQDDPELKSSIHPYLETDTTAAFDIKSFSIMLGINHSSFGPFFGDNIVLSSNSKHNGSIAIVFNAKMLTLTEAMFILRAQDGYHSKNMPSKYLFIQSADVNLNKYISFSIYDACVYGERFDPAYLIPCPFIITEGITGYNEDNVFMGSTLTVRPITGLAWKTNFFLDDAGFEKFSKFKDITLRASLQTGITYVPTDISWLNVINAEYTFITPYMYTHIAHYGWKTQEGFTPVTKLSNVNYQVYDSAGQALASALPPDSDRITLCAKFNPTKKLNVNTSLTMIRHGNVNESLPSNEAAFYLLQPQGDFTTDGGILNHSYCPGASDLETSNWYKINLLTQEHIEYTFQGSIQAEYSLQKSKWGQLSFMIGYAFEYIHNYGIDNEMYPGYTNGNIPSWAIIKEEKINYNASVKTTGAAEAVAKAHQDWVEQLTDVFTNYITLKVIYRF